ncbi:MAG: hypothetical protein HY871_07695 [Chloroflexi bacterium]|nr:hypothetical protein [Chloroflexota bacterium]
MKAIERALWDCLIEIQDKGRPVEECLARHPELADELAPLVHTATTVRQVPHPEPSPGFRSGASVRLLNRIHAWETACPSPGGATQWFPRPVRLRSWAVTWLARAMIAMICAALFGGGAVLAARDSLPDSPLYGTKLVMERVQLRLAVTEGTRATLLMRFADERVREMQALAAKGKGREAAQLAVQYAKDVTQAQKSIESGPEGNGKTLELLLRFDAQVKRHEGALDRVRQQVPEEVRPAINEALEASRRGQAKAREAIERRKSPPAQEKRETPPPGQDRGPDQPPGRRRWN